MLENEKLVEQAKKYFEEALLINRKGTELRWEEKVKHFERATELSDRAIYLYLRAAELADSNIERVKRIANARFVERNKFTSLANKSKALAEMSFGKDKTDALREAALYGLSSYSAAMEIAEIHKMSKHIPSYNLKLGEANIDKAWYYYYLGWAAEEDRNWIEALEHYKKSDETFRTAVESLNKSLHSEFNKKVENVRSETLRVLKSVAEDRKDAEQRASLQLDGLISVEEEPVIKLEIMVSGLRKNVYCPIQVKIRNLSSAMARNIVIKIDGDADGVKGAKLETLIPGYETQLALSLKPTKKGKARFKVFSEYSDEKNNVYSAKIVTIMGVASLTDTSITPKIISIENFDKVL